MPKVTPRILRMKQEHAEMLQLERQSSLIAIKCHGDPATQYDVEFRCKGLKQVSGGIAISDSR